MLRTNDSEDGMMRGRNEFPGHWAAKWLIRKWSRPSSVEGSFTSLVSHLEMFFFFFFPALKRSVSPSKTFSSFLLRANAHLLINGSSQRNVFWILDSSVHVAFCSRPLYFRGNGRAEPSFSDMDFLGTLSSTFESRQRIVPFTAKKRRMHFLAPTLLMPYKRSWKC